MNPLALVLIAASLSARLSLAQDQPQPTAVPLPATQALKTASKDKILFRNGDLLTGNLELVDPAQEVRWRHADAFEPIEFKPETVAEIQFGYRDQPKTNSAATNICQVRLTNQDELSGSLLSSDSERIVLETWYAGRIEIPRKMVQFIMPKIEEGPLLFAGPEGLEEWTIGQVNSVPDAGVWKYKDGAFYATRSASVARDLKLPDVAKIECDLTWKGVLYMAIALYTDYLHPVNLQSKETGPEFGGFYSLQLRHYIADLLPVTKKEPIRYLGQAPIPTVSQKNKIHLDIRVNKPKRTIALLVDGVLVKQWIETEDFVGQGTGVRFVHQGHGAIKLSNIRVSQWNGQFEEKPSPTPNSKDDIARLQNGDRAVGQLQAIRDGKVTFAPAAGAPLDIPLNRVKVLEFASLKADRANEDNADIKATFRSGGSIALRLEKWSEGEVIGTSPNFGRITLNPLAFERVQFNLKPGAKPSAAIPNDNFQQGKAVVRAVRGFAEFQAGEDIWKPLHVGKVLAMGAVIRTAADSLADLFLGENGPVVRVTSDSTLGLVKLNFRRDGPEVVIETQLSLAKGRILTNVRELTANSKYEILTAKGVIPMRPGGGEAAVDAER
ncbi:MAG: hypothetical protein FJ403_12125 [Verrucomicrobia bacterium]|nr:hypothetical protein [Verrucomicrobiota bacterium]